MQSGRPRSRRAPASGRLRAGEAGFDFTSRMRRLIADMVTRLPELRHIDLDRVAISFSQARKRVTYGLQATLTPMRFENGALRGERRGRWFEVQQLLDTQGREMLYILSFYLPRFMDVDFDEKLVTIFHELWHISPYFDGDIRRHPGRCYAHTHSQEEYDAKMARLAKRWLDEAPPEELYTFLHLDFSQLQHQWGRVYGLKITQPKLIPVASREGA